MILIGPEDAILLFKKWSTERTEVVCLGGKCQIRGTVSHRSGGEFAMSSADGTGRLEVSLDAEGLLFGYAETSELSGLQPVASGLIVSMPSGERLTFIELPLTQ